MVVVREYEPRDERSWLECRVLSYLDSAYYDDVHTRKSVFSNPVIDLVAECDSKIVGLIEIECETEPGTLCRDGAGPAAMIWNIVVLPQYRRQQIATKLLREAERIALGRGVVRFEAYTRDDPWVVAWYVRNGFTRVMSYLHVYMDSAEHEDVLTCSVRNLKPISTFAHYTGEEKDSIRERFKRVHECTLFELNLGTDRRT